MVEVVEKNKEEKMPGNIFRHMCSINLPGMIYITCSMATFEVTSEA